MGPLGLSTHLAYLGLLRSQVGDRESTFLPHAAWAYTSGERSSGGALGGSGGGGEKDSLVSSLKERTACLMIRVPPGEKTRMFSFLLLFFCLVCT